MKKESVRFQFEKEIAWETPSPGVERQIMAYNEQLMVVKVKFEQGAVGTAHTHPHTQATYVAEGRFEFTTAGETRIIEKGDGVYIRPNELHSCKCLEQGILIDTFNPARRDFLE